jgi:3D (Asp-Asp-Asp) domain-containing protein
MGADSIKTINLTVNSSTSSSITTTSCGPYTAPDGAIYAVTGNYTAVIPNSNGCDSTIAIDVTVTDIDTSLTLNGNELEAVNDSSYNYQWVDCDLNLAIPGETNSLMTVTESGNYKVIISTSNCVDTSGCANVIVANTLELNNYNIRLYPNPAKQFVTLSGDLTQVKVDVFDLNGKRVHTGIKQSERYTVPVANWPRGMYLFRTTYRGTVQTAKISLE